MSSGYQPGGGGGGGGATGATGPAGPGVPTGGATGTVLTKTSAVDYATAFQAPTGGGGSTLTVTPVKTANYTAAANEYVLCDSSAGTFTLTLPAAQPDGTRVRVIRLAGTAANWVNLTVSAGTMNGVTLLGAVGMWAEFTYQASTTTWRQITGITPSGTPLDVFAVPGGPLSIGNQRLIGVGDATAATDALNQESGDLRYLYNLTVVNIPKTANYNAAAGEYVLFDTTGGAITLTLPTAPPNGTLVGGHIVTLGAGNFVNVACGGSDVFNKAGGPATQTAALQYATQTVVFEYWSGIWQITVMGAGLAALDTRYVNETDMVSLAAGQDLQLGAVVGGVQTIGTSTAAHNFIVPSLYVEAAAVQVINNSTTQADDLELFLALVANARYRFTAMISYTTDVTADWRHLFTATTANLKWAPLNQFHTALPASGTGGGPIAVSPINASGGNVVTGGAGTATPVTVHFQGIATTVAADTLKYRWAPFAAAAFDSTRLVGSWLCAERIT